jgi:uncharacterized membrane protein YfcA
MQGGSGIAGRRHFLNVRRARDRFAVARGGRNNAGLVMVAKILILEALIFAAFMVNTVTGFAGSILALALGVHLFSIESLVPVIVILNLVISVYIVALHHEAIDRRLLLREIIPATGLGVAIGIVLFNFSKTNTLKVAFGIFVIGFSLLELFIILFSKDGSSRKPLSVVQSYFWLFSGGVMHGLYASGGPPIVYYAGRNIPDKRAFRSTLSAMWVILNTVILVSDIATGKFTAKSLWLATLLLPALALGIALGECLHPRIPERSFRILVFSLLVVAGVLILF